MQIQSEVLPVGQSVHEAAPEAEYFPAAQSVAVSAARPAPSESQSSAAGGVLTGSRAATVMAPSAAPSDEVMMYPVPPCMQSCRSFHWSTRPR